MQISLSLNGKRGKQYRLVISQMGADVGGGILYQVQEWRAYKWVEIASDKHDTADALARILAGWLTTPMPPLTLKDVFPEEL